MTKIPERRLWILNLVWSIPVVMPASSAPVYIQVLQLDNGAKEGVSFTPGLKIEVGT